VLAFRRHQKEFYQIFLLVEINFRIETFFARRRRSSTIDEYDRRACLCRFVCESELLKSGTKEKRRANWSTVAFVRRHRFTTREASKSNQNQKLHCNQGRHHYKRTVTTTTTARSWIVMIECRTAAASWGGSWRRPVGRPALGQAAGKSVGGVNRAAQELRQKSRPGWRAAALWVGRRQGDTRDGRPADVNPERRWRARLYRAVTLWPESKPSQRGRRHLFDCTKMKTSRPDYRRAAGT
jgi:hypothetical protein